MLQRFHDPAGMQFPLCRAPWLLSLALLAASAFVACAQPGHNGPGYQPQAAAERPPNSIRVASYNVENLFDLVDDPQTKDEEFTPNGANRWTEQRLMEKLDDIGRVLLRMGNHSYGLLPELIGLVEVESQAVLDELVVSLQLGEAGPRYRAVMHDTKGYRGIDNALIYYPKRFEVVRSKAHPVRLAAKPGYSWRDFLQVDGRLRDGSLLTVIVNHWPSRHNDASLRLATARKLKAVTDSIRRADPQRAMILMGDFNDEPTSPSLRLLGAETERSAVDPGEFYNAMAPSAERGEGSYCYRGEWNMLDNLLVSHTLLPRYAGQATAERPQFIVGSGRVYSPEWLRQDGPPRFEGYPDRTYVGERYLGGPSDHFPVYLDLTVPE